jgi:hypothetical protein
VSVRGACCSGGNGWGSVPGPRGFFSGAFCVSLHMSSPICRAAAAVVAYSCGS